jgi:hypothetical protein
LEIVGNRKIWKCEKHQKEAVGDDKPGQTMSLKELDKELGFA